MAVNNTESRLPEGFGPWDLGEIDDITFQSDSDCFLISYLSSPLTLGSKNTYVILFDKDAVNLKDAVQSYHWKVFENRGKSLIEVENKPDQTTGVFEYTPKNQVTIKVSVDVVNISGDALRSLEIWQNVVGINEKLEELFQKPTLEFDSEIIEHHSALGGNKDTTRELVNELKPLIDDVFYSVNDDFKVPKMLLAAIVYLQALRVPKDRTTLFALAERFRNPEIEKVAQELNDKPLFSLITHIDNAIGVCQIAPQTLAMLLEDPTAPPSREYQTYIRRRKLPSNENGRDGVRKEILDDYKALTPEKKIDLFNLLRFPRSNIRMCFELLNYLKNRPNRYPDVSTDDLLQKIEYKQAIQIIGTEFQIGAIDSKKPTSDPPLSNEAKINQYGKDVLKTMYSPFLVLDFDGMLKISGKVTEKGNLSKVIKGARVDLYQTQLEIINSPTLKCFKEQDTNLPFIKLQGPQTDAAGNTILGEILPVLEVIWPENNSGIVWVKVRKISNVLDDNEGWVVAKYNKAIYGKLLSNRTEKVATTDNKGEFSFAVRQYTPYKLRVVKDPTGVDGYFDGEREIQEVGLPKGWFKPPKMNINIEMEPAKHIIKESDFLNLLLDWEGYAYASDWRPKFPNDENGNDYYLSRLKEHGGILGFSEAGNLQIACNSFVQALITQAWYKQNEDDFYWSWSHNQRSGNVDATQGEDHPFSSVRIYSLEIIINILKNPNSNFTITVDGTKVNVNLGANVEETATNIENALNRKDTVSARVSVWSRGVEHPPGNLKYAYLVISPKGVLSPYDIDIITNKPDNEIKISPKIWEATAADVQGPNEFPPPWSIVQGWRNWNPPSSIPGHNFFIVDVNPRSKKVLTLEARSTDNVEGIGFRNMWIKKGTENKIEEKNDSGDIDKHKVGNEINPNKDFHWTFKVNMKWDDIWDEYDKYNDTLGISRLKLYDLQWSGPIL